MPSISVPQFWQDFAADGDATGNIQVADSSGFYVGCLAYIQSDNDEARVIIVAVPDSTHVTVRIVADDNNQQAPLQRYGGHSDLSAYTVLLNSRVSMEEQVARVEPAFASIRRANV